MDVNSVMAAPKIKLCRVNQNAKERYYRLEISRTLFGDFEVQRVYGASCNKRPTGQRRDLFCTYEDAKMFYDNILFAKRKRGYCESVLYA